MFDLYILFMFKLLTIKNHTTNTHVRMYVYICCTSLDSFWRRVSLGTLKYKELL